MGNDTPQTPDPESELPQSITRRQMYQLIRWADRMRSEACRDRKILERHAPTSEDFYRADTALHLWHEVANKLRGVSAGIEE